MTMNSTMPTAASGPQKRPAPAYPAPSNWQLAKVAIERAVAADSKTVLVLGFNAPNGDPLGWLAHHQGVPSVYWRGRDGWEYAGIGVTHLIAARGPDAMLRTANEAVSFLRGRVISETSPQARRPRFFGGFAFDPQNPDRGIWEEAGFGDAALILPEAVYARRENQSYVFFSFEVTPRTTPDSLIERLAVLNSAYWSGFECPSRLDVVSFTEEAQSLSSDYARWVESSSAVLRGIAAGELDKVVLAECRTLRLETGAAELNPWPVVAALRDFDPACYQFGFQFGDRHVFVGASPERLFRLSGQRVETEAVAGTTTRGRNEAEDQMLAGQLAASVKDQLEHRYVDEALRDGLRTLAVNGANATQAQLDVVRLRTLQHLRSVISTELRPDVTLGDILTTLHPTPAVCGVPRERAREVIRLHEKEPRGWYGGPVGWVGAEAAEFSVAIRSALLSRDRVRLYAGAGLVRGSLPDNEWQEIQDKLQTFQSAVKSPR